MRRCALVLIVLLPFVAGSVVGQSAGSIHHVLAAEADHLKTFGADPTLVGFVKAQNARNVTLGAIQKMDKEWTAGAAPELVHSVTTGACADYLRKTFGEQERYAEVFVMDDKGALVCANQKTSDYWQGDEDKWIRSFNGGSGTTFIDRPRFDDSSKLNMSQISIPILDGGKTIGVLMVGVKVDKLVAAK